MILLIKKLKIYKKTFKNDNLRYCLHLYVDIFNILMIKFDQFKKHKKQPIIVERLRLNESI